MRHKILSHIRFPCIRFVYCFFFVFVFGMRTDIHECEWTPWTTQLLYIRKGLHKHKLKRFFFIDFGWVCLYCVVVDVVCNAVLLLAWRAQNLISSLRRIVAGDRQNCFARLLFHNFKFFFSINCSLRCLCVCFVWIYQICSSFEFNFEFNFVAA